MNAQSSEPRHFIRGVLMVALGVLIAAACLLGCGFILLGLIFGKSGSAERAAPAGRVETVHSGDIALLGGPLKNGVWLASTRDDFDSLLDAQNAAAEGGPGAGSMLYRLAESGRARIYPVKSRIRVTKREMFTYFVELLDGEDKGQSGWVQSEFVEPYVATRLDDQQGQPERVQPQPEPTPEPESPARVVRALPKPNVKPLIPLPDSRDELRTGAIVEFTEGKVPVAVSLGVLKDLYSYLAGGDREAALGIIDSRQGFLVEAGVRARIVSLDTRAAEVEILPDSGELTRRGWTVRTKLGLTGQELLDSMKRANLEKQRADAERYDASSKQKDSLMRLGLNLEKASKRDAALKWYAQIIKDRPGTPAAEAAADRVKALGGK